MKKLLNFLPTHFTICLILGIVLQFYVEIWCISFVQSIIFWLTFLVLLAGVKILKQQKVFTFLSWVFFFFLGMFAVFIQDDKNYENYYAHVKSEEGIAFLRVDKTLKPNRYYDKYIATIVKVDAINTKGKILLNIENDSTKERLGVYDKILIFPTFLEIQQPLNPYQFNYSSYLEKQGILKQVIVKRQQYLKFSSTDFSIYKLADKFRKTIQKSLQKQGFKKEELAVINALLLGQRQDISKELLNDYTRAGAIHILAVSGLHVGIFLLILSAFFKPLEQLKYGKIIKTILIVCLLWIFAVIAGLSASVVRAVTMFSAVAIAMAFNRKTMVLHSLISSMFILLLCKPLFLFDVGFQLSYLAVFSIVTIQPKLYNLWKPKYKLIDKLWQLFTVSTSAQLGVLPISLFYFHQFPGLFMISNLVIIPFIGSILMGGILMIGMSLLNVLPLFLANIYGFIISGMNIFVSWISKQESFLIENISFSLLSLLTTYALLFFGFRFFIKKSSKRSLLFLLMIVVFQLGILFEKYNTKSQQELIIFHKSRQTIIAERKSHEIKIYHDVDSLKILKSNEFTPYIIRENIKKVTYFQHFPAVMKLQKSTLILVDSLNVYQIKGIKNAIVLLRQSPKINIERLIKLLDPKEIIADGSNYKSQVLHWKMICEKYKVPFHYTGTAGAKILEK